VQFATINETVLHYQLIGAPAGKPVLVFINSLGTDFRIWRDVIVRLAGDFAIVTYDKRGHGLSSLGEAPHRIETYAADLAGLLDLLGQREVILCGLSIGGVISLALHAARPELIRAMILCDTAHRIGTHEMWNGRIASARSAGIESFADGVMEKWFTPDFHARRADDLAGYRTMLVRQSVDGYAAACEAIREADFTEAARAVNVPTLCVVGDQDGSTPPALVKSLADLVPGAGYEVIAGAGHIPCVEQPENLVDLIRAFVREKVGGGHG
jgi:3-oxoadipate enol-lactonase